jgi:hypothetical protein
LNKMCNIIVAEREVNMNIFDVALAGENEARKEWNKTHADNPLTLWGEQDKPRFIQHGSCPSNCGCEDDCGDKSRSTIKCTKCFEREVH